MKITYLSLSLTGWLTSCGHLEDWKEPLLFGAGGAALGSALLDDKPAAAAAGSMAGTAAGLGVQAYGERQRQRAYQSGFERSRLDQAKQRYWQSKRAQAFPSLGNPLIYRYVDIPVPGHFKDGAHYEPHTQTIEIVE